MQAVLESSTPASHMGSATVLAHPAMIERSAVANPSLAPAFFRQLAERKSGIVWATDRDLRVTALFGGGPAKQDSNSAEWLGRTLIDCFQADDEACRTIAAHCRALRGDTVDDEQVWQGRTYQLHIEPLSDEGRIIGCIGFAQDITEQRRADDDPRRGEARLRSVIDHAPAQVATVDRQGKILFINRAVPGLTLEQVVGSSVYDYLQPEHCDQARQCVEQVFQTGETVVNESKATGPFGSVAWYETRLGPVKVDGQVIAATLISSDITERKLAETVLRESEERFRKVFEEGPLGVAIVGIDGRIQRANPRLCEMLGQSEEEITQLGIQGITHPDDWEMDRQPVSRLASGEIHGYCLKKRYLHQSGRVIWAQLTASLMTDSDGRPTAIIELVEDLTERKAAEDSLSKAKWFAECLIASMLDGFVVLNAQGVHVQVNDASCRMTGFARDELIGIGLPHPYWPPEHLEAIRHVYERTTAGEADQFELVFMRKSGERFPVIVAPSQVKDADGAVVNNFATFKDISQRKLAEAALQASEVKYRRLHHSMRDAFVSVRMDGQIQEFNDAYRQLLGYEPEDLASLSYQDLTPSQWHPIEAAIVRDQVLPRGYSEIYEKEYRRKNGTIVPVELRTFLVADDRGDAAAMWAIIRDITERKAAEAALKRSHAELEEKVRERTAELVQTNAFLRAEMQKRLGTEKELLQSEAKYRALVESSPNAIVMCDLDGMIVFASQRSAEQHGFAEARELVGRSVLEFVVPEERAVMKANLRRLIREGIRRNTEYRGLRRDETTFYGEISAAVIRDSSGQPQWLMGVYQDITQRKQADAQLRANNAELLAAAEIQAHLLPQEPPQLEGFDIAGHCYPAEVAAGDHFDYLRLSDGALLVVLADVSGHGLGPAIVAADFCARLRTLSENVCDPLQIATRLHSGLYKETVGEVFVTAFFGKLDPTSRRLTGLNAGHPDAIVLNRAGEIKARFASGGPPFAILPEVAFAADTSVDLETGDVVLFYTDGLVEIHRPNEPLFGLDRVLELVRANQHRPAAEIVEVLHHSACEYAKPSPPTDDITIVIAKVFDAMTTSAPPSEKDVEASAAIVSTLESGEG